MSAPVQPPSTVISKENIKVAAETVGVELTEDVVKTLCHEVEYRVREILQVRPCLNRLSHFHSSLSSFEVGQNDCTLDLCLGRRA